MKNTKEMKYYVAIVLLVAIYLLFVCLRSDNQKLKDIIATVATLIGVVTFWLEFRRSKNLQEANFIMNLNEQFVSNKEMTKVEAALEQYYVHVSEGNFPNLNLNFDVGQEEQQALINYLVHMEGLAALVQREVLHLGIIDDLFAYRFFIAVNNPIVQQRELLPYANFYQGCFWLSKMWTEQWRRNNREIPLDETSLCSCVPLLCHRVDRKEDVYIRKANSKDSFYSIAKCLYMTDSYIYPAAFGKDERKAEKIIEKLMQIEDGLFHYKNIILAFMKKRLCGVLLYNKNGATWDTEEYLSLLGDCISDEKKFRHVSQKYFSKECERTKCNGIEIIALCVLPQYRKQGIGEKLLKGLIGANPNCQFELDVLAENTTAISIYKKCGFEIEKKIKGFGMEHDAVPDCYRMIRKKN